MINWIKSITQDGITKPFFDWRISFFLTDVCTLTDLFQTPAPGAYNPEKVHPQRERKAPRWSLGVRTRFRKCDQNPAPSNYKLPPVLGPSQASRTSAPSYSMTGNTSKHMIPTVLPIPTFMFNFSIFILHFKYKQEWLDYVFTICIRSVPRGLLPRRPGWSAGTRPHQQDECRRLHGPGTSLYAAIT